ncbi:MAG: ATP-binding protein [Candidatus Aenigmarchaeota archaeon]|nr:ATP-binding protein [Candidatus Aenigmarchaeota archaeon]
MEQEQFEQFFKNYYEQELLKIAAEGKKSIVVDFKLLDKFDPILADKLLNDPITIIEEAKRALKNIDLPEGPIDIIPRFTNLPEQQNVRIRNLRSEHMNKFLTIEGVVKRASEVKPNVSVAIFECPDCGSKIPVEQKDSVLRAPTYCECGRKNGFNLIEKKLFDVMWLIVEEPYDITEGEQQGKIAVYLSHDLTTPEMQNKCEPGNRLKINGILLEKKKQSRGKENVQLDTYLLANYVEATEIEWEEVNITDEDIEKIKQAASDSDIYNKLISSIAPSIYGLDEVKEAILLQMFGGVPRTLADGVRLRGDIHILLLGDPSCLVADERIVMADGTIMKIGSMGSKHLENINYNVHVGIGRKVGKATTFHKYTDQPIIEIITETGKSIRGTYNQPVLINQNRKQVWKRLDEVEIGDKVQVISKIECRKKTYIKTNWKDYPYYHKAWHIKIPEVVDKDLAAIFGYIIADGWIQKYRVGFVINEEEADILPKLEKAFKKCFNVIINSQKQRKSHPKIVYYQIDRTHLANILSFLKQKRVPDLIFQSGNKVVASFLRWLYEGDGCVFSKGRGSLSVSLRSNNIELLRDVQILLLRFGIHSRILWEDKEKISEIANRKIKSKPSGNLMIRRSNSIIKFSKHIGFVSKKKKAKLKKAVEYAKKHIHRIHNKRTERIVKINKLKSQDVFDIEVPKYKRFVANGIIVHNTAKTQLLKLVSQIIPRGKYVSGKGTSAAGLTATVVKDELSGGWALEAGAMVLANKGIIAIDEFDKISHEDQVAMHEAMSTQTISIAKASIVATLPSKVGVLAGANPKLMRFDPGKSVAEQITIPDTLLSRFDLKFALRDIPDKERDEKLATHVFETRLNPKRVVPIFDPIFLRKYITYARKNCEPQMTREAAEKLKNFYLDMRAQSEGGMIAITLRQSDALFRLAEASAKIRLSNYVEEQDAQRAINLMRYSIMQLGYDSETGKFDVDKLEGSVSASKRTKINRILDIIAMLEKKLGKPVAKDEVFAAAEDEGISEQDVKEILISLKSGGEIFEPKTGFIQRV